MITSFLNTFFSSLLALEADRHCSNQDHLYQQIGKKENGTNMAYSPKMTPQIALKCSTIMAVMLKAQTGER